MPTIGRPFAIHHHSFFDQLDNVSKVIETLNVGLQQIRPKLNILFVEGVGLEVAVEFLQGRVLKVSEIKIMDGEVVDEKFGDLYEFC
jgi:regulator of replication initiation timing